MQSSPQQLSASLPEKSVGRDTALAFKVVLITNIPAPYRQPVYEKLANYPRLDLTVVYCSNREPDREWKLPEPSYKRVTLIEKFVTWSGRYIHFNTDVWRTLTRLSPQAIVTTGYNPTHLLAFLYARRYHVPHIVMTDGTFESERKLSFMHRMVRHIVFAGSETFVGASEGAFTLFRQYGIETARMFKSHLCANNENFMKPMDVLAPAVDLLFSARLVECKNPQFALEVAELVAKRMGRKVTLAVLGNGPLMDKLQASSQGMSEWVDVDFRGFIQQEDLPRHFQSSRVFLFPSSWDPWGVVANEACAAGVPVIVSPYAGVAGELVVDADNGFVRPLDMELWVDATVRLLQDEVLHRRFADRSRERVRDYSFENAAHGLRAAIFHAARMPGDAEQPAAIRPASPQPCVMIVQRRLTHYRIPLFEQLREDLARSGVRLRVIHGEPMPFEKKREDDGSLGWSERVFTRYFFGGIACWQDIGAHLKDVDLVIVTQENKLLFNYWLMLRRDCLPMAYWGHGRNFQTKFRASFRERMKRQMTKYADWWFAYTHVSASIVSECGFPSDRITVLNNAVDTAEMQKIREHIGPDDLAACRSELGIGSGPIGIFVGSLDPVKNLPLLFASAHRIKAVIPDFQLLIVGNGPEHDLVEQQVKASGGWIHWVGARKGEDKVKLICLSQVMLNPGMVGLGILDSFSCGVPMVTTQDPRHSPEIAYLEPGVNGMQTMMDEEDFARVAIRLILDTQFHARLAEGCLISAREYTLEHMVQNFANGILACLQNIKNRSPEVQA